MISLLKAIEDNREEALRVALESYRTALVAVGEAGARACPPAREPFQASLSALSDHLTQDAGLESVEQTTAQVISELQSWSTTANEHFEQYKNELREVLLLVANASGEIGVRDKHYAAQFGELAQRLKATSELTDLAAIRTSLRRSTTEFAASIARMTSETQESLKTLNTQLSVYQARVQEVEHLALVDPLTGVLNRRGCDAQLKRRINEGRVFSVIYLDLNEFKLVNDTYGHEAGDDVLRQFAAALERSCRSDDVVARWGGDEFLMIVDGSASDAATCCARIEERVFGTYTLNLAEPQKITITASAGVASWQRDDTEAGLLSRADSAMYERKQRDRSLKR